MNIDNVSNLETSLVEMKIWRSMSASWKAEKQLAHRILLCLLDHFSVHSDI
jgi:hypothetical protein